jgi:hypothetical protein
MKLEKPTLFQSALLLILVGFCILYYQQSKNGRYVFSGTEYYYMMDTRNGNVYFLDENSEVENGNGKWKIGIKMD